MKSEKVSFALAGLWIEVKHGGDGTTSSVAAQPTMIRLLPILGKAVHF